MMEQNDALSGQGALPESDTPAEGINNTNMESLLENEGLTLELPQPGEIREGVIASISPTQVLVSVGAKSEGVIAGRELEQISTSERETFEVGNTIQVYVLATEDENGNIVLSYNRALEQKGWQLVEEMLESDESHEGEIEGYNKGGLIVPVHGLRGFVPASQVSFSRRAESSGDTPDQRWAKMVGSPIVVRVIEVDRSRRRLILSERAASTETRQSLKERVIEELQEGEIRTGRVTSLADFGAFVNISGADGLVHLSEISWDRIQHPSEVLEVGQEVTVKIINIDKEKKRIGLSLRALVDDPWRKKVEKFRVGQLVEGVITRLTKFGAFARLEGDVEGLVHISEISDTRIEHPKERLKEGEVVTLRIVRIDTDQRRIGLSLRKVDSGAYKDIDLANIDLEELGAEEVKPQEPVQEEIPEEAPQETSPEEIVGDAPEEMPLETSLEEIVGETPEEIPQETSSEEIAGDTPEEEPPTPEA
jgi:small subunit ribosomal protein S1